MKMSREEEIHNAAMDVSNRWKRSELLPTQDEIIAYDAAVTMAEWVDQNPKEGLWDSEKVVEWILNNYETYEQTYSDNSGNHTYSDFQIGQFIRNLRKAMEEIQ